MTVPSTIQDCLRHFCQVVADGGEDGDVFHNVRREVQAFGTMPWPADGDVPVREYMAVPNHVFACTDLDYKRFATTPLVVGNQQLHIFHILELFSRTNPQRYATVWAPLLDLAEAVTTDGSRQQALRQAREHVRRQCDRGGGAAAGAGAAAAAGVASGAGAPPTQQLDDVMQNLLGTIPGLQGMVQQMMNATDNAGADGGGGIGAMLNQIQGLLNPLLNQAAASATTQDPHLQPAIGQILSGFSALTQALSCEQQSQPQDPSQPTMLE